jgi:hypothetical protein
MHHLLFLEKFLEFSWLGIEQDGQVNFLLFNSIQNSFQIKFESHKSRRPNSRELINFNNYDRKGQNRK